MKKFLLGTLAIWFSVAPLFASSVLKQSTATQVVVEFLDATDGITAETALTVTTFDCNLVKHADSGMAATALTITASGGSNDSAHLADGLYSLELTATDTNTVGRLVLKCQCSGAMPFTQTYTVKSAAAYDSDPSGSIASIDDIWEYPVTSIGTAGGIGLQIETNLDVASSTRLAPTVPGTTLDVHATGTAGIDWSNIENSSATVNLSATTINSLATADWTATERSHIRQRLGIDGTAATPSATPTLALQSTSNTITAGVSDLQNRVPSFLINGRIDSTVGEMQTGVLTAAAVAADAFTAAKFAADVTTEFQSGLATASSVADAIWDEPRAGHTTAGTFGEGVLLPDNSLTSAKIAPDAIGGSELASDSGTEIAAAVWNEATTGHVGVGSFGQVLASIRSGTAQAGAATTITLDTGASSINEFYTNHLIKITGGTGAGQARFINAYTGATRVATVATWTTNPASDSVFVIIPFGLIPGATAPSAAVVADAVWDEVRSGHVGAGTFGEGIPLSAGAITAASIATDAFTAAKFATDVTTEFQANLATAAALTTVQADTDNLQTRIPTALISGRIDSTVGAMQADVVTAASIAAGAITSSEAPNLDQPITYARNVIRAGTAQAGTATSITLDAGASSITNAYLYKRIVLTAGTGLEQSAIITAYNGTTKVATTFCEGTVAGSWLVTPASNTVFVIMPADRR